MTDLRADLTGKRALVTGGGAGIGAAIALALADAGAEVVITGRRERPLKETAARSSRIAWRVMDVTDEAAVTESFVATAPIDIMVANAGVAETQPVAKTTLEFWRHVQATNVEGVMLCVREALKPMVERGWGRVIIVSSVAGLRGLRYGSAYCASKHAVLGLMKCAAEEVLKTGVTVNAICPGYVATGIVERNVENIVARTGMSEENALAALRDANPFGRMIEADEVAAAALWLCGPGSGAVTAQAIPVSGGRFERGRRKRRGGGGFGARTGVENATPALAAAAEDDAGDRGGTSRAAARPPREHAAALRCARGAGAQPGGAADERAFRGFAGLQRQCHRHRRPARGRRAGAPAGGGGRPAGDEGTADRSGRAAFRRDGGGSRNLDR